MSHYYYQQDDLKNYAIRYFIRWGVPADDASIAADVLVSSDARGVDSHGMIRLNSYYGSRLRKGLINPLSPMTILKETPTTLAIDGHNGLGHPLGVKTMRRCIEKASDIGLAFATVRCSNHYGIAGYYAMMALPHDMIGISFTNSGPLVAPTHSKIAMLGTNPIAVAVPAHSQRPFVLDMATSIVPIGRVQVYQKEGKPIPSGWGVNSQGVITEDASQVINGGALMPLGGSDIMRGYKGYGLALLVDIFAGVLADAGFSDTVTGSSSDKPANVGHFFGAVKIEAFREINSFKQSMDELLTKLKNAPKAEGEERIYIHGEKEFENADRSAVEGVRLSETTVNILKKTGLEDGVEFDLNPLKVE